MPDFFVFLHNYSIQNCVFGVVWWTIINCSVWQRVTGFIRHARQTVLLSQNASHPQVPLQCRNNKKIQHISDVLYFLVEATGLEPTTFWSLRHNRKFFIDFPSISKSFVSATDAFLYSCSHCFHVVQIRKWSNMWSFRLHAQNWL